MNTQTVPTHCYLGRLPCGCAVELFTEWPNKPKRTARMKHEMERAGLTVVRVPIDVGRNAFVLECPHGKAKR